MARPQGLEGLGMADLGETLGSPWIPLAIRACWHYLKKIKETKIFFAGYYKRLSKLTASKEAKSVASVYKPFLQAAQGHLLFIACLFSFKKLAILTVIMLGTFRVTLVISIYKTSIFERI
jgi:hypothetical protein